MAVEDIAQGGGFALHLDDVASDAALEIAMEDQCRYRDDHAGGGAHQCLADAAGELVHVANAAVQDAQEHLNHSHHGAEQAKQRPGRGHRTQRVQEPLHAMHDVAAGVLDAFADDLARPVAHVQAGGKQLAQCRIAPQRLDVDRVELAAGGPVAHFLAQPRRQHFATAQAPEPLQDDRQRDHAQQQQRHHRPATGLDQFPHVATLRHVRPFVHRPIG